MKITWNPIGRFLERRRDKRRYNEIASQVEERDNLAEMFTRNPDLHARVILQGQHFIHYINLDEDLAELQARVADEPEMKCRWN